MKTKKLIEKVVPQLFAIDQQKGSLQAEDVYLVVEQTGLAEENIRTLGVQIINKMLAEHGLEIQQGITINDLIADAVSDLYLMNENGTLELDDVYDQSGRRLTEEERLQLQNQINAQRGLYGVPPANGRIELVDW